MSIYTSDPSYKESQPLMTCHAHFTILCMLCLVTATIAASAWSPLTHHDYPNLYSKIRLTNCCDPNLHSKISLCYRKCLIQQRKFAKTLRTPPPAHTQVKLALYFTDLVSSNNADLQDLAQHLQHDILLKLAVFLCLRFLYCLDKLNK
jgi:hypothetical protein